MTVNYEWDVETVTAAEGAGREEKEVLDHRFCTSYVQARKIADGTAPEGCRYEIVLVRDDDDRRSWAYLIDGVLPDYAEDANGDDYGKIPKRFRDEVAET